ncbi:limonene-1,2-epoxide hydrolase family protein [Williamsia deligens]|uniref:Limonene-1,2-epoxide hydrolase family protein n=1 Tax=Williamsia deligens TaxID=321325 RepID=A0ABW3G9L0_9NOCA|nr:limonene-1,2-epoxide hydrolase family protein [Williamsia deligens]MCP2192473.1 limonene-1,2-epoxide hydrolase [Williamsia deligens]
MTSMQHCLLWSAEDVAIRFLESLALGDAEIARHLLAPEVRYRFAHGVAWRGRDRVSRRLQRVVGDRGRFDVAIHDVTADAVHGSTDDAFVGTAHAEQVVRTLRTDHLRVGPVHLQFPVHGVATVRDGKIAVWDDRVDGTAVASALARGLCGAVVPGVRPHLPRP